MTKLNHKGGHGALLQQALRGPHRQSEYTHRQDLHHLNLVSLEAQRALSTDLVQPNQPKPVQLDRTNSPKINLDQNTHISSRNHDQPLVFDFVLPAPATNAGALLAGPPPGPYGSNETKLGSNRWLTREKWSLQVDSPAIQHRRNHLLVFAFGLPYPATNAGVLPTGPPPGRGGSNGTNHGPNHALTREN
ncbi:calcineurin B-like protein 4 [Dorcoceras hygrometricum]|uniref:Calcineurin B-like protein 4 n=1 Tax=Dorcoceras hygrometricum TaxID=472368 RepID=A0A2Z7B0Y7_9LAMI|nr:calcineurin B-like protein 4 [Dorcoceras hygrometricum]